MRFPVAGFYLDVDEFGTPISAVLVEPVPEEPALALSPLHWIGCCSTNDRRTTALDEIDHVLEDAGIADYLALFVDHDRSNPAVIHPYLCYLVLARVPAPVGASLRDGNIFGIDDYCNAGETDYPDWQVEEAIIAAFHSRWFGKCDSMEQGYPEKLTGLLELAWSVTSVHRRGKLRSQTAYSDDFLIHLCSVESRNAVLYRRLIRPEFSLGWTNTLDNVAYTLQGNPVWQQGTLYYLADIAQRFPRCSVSIECYNPMNFLMYLYDAIRKDDSRYFPSIRILVINDKEMRLLLGKLCWNGTRARPPEEVINRAFGSFDEFFLSQPTQTAWEYENTVCELYGLSYRLTEVIGQTNDPIDLRELVVGDEGCQWVTVDRVDDSFHDFLASSSDHFEALCKLFSTFFVE